jgi:RimJ/RimL family protein N-acetyltransferase
VNTKYPGKRIYIKRLSIDEIDDRYISWFSNKDLLKYYSGTKRVWDREYFINDIESGVKNKTHYIYGIYMNDTDLLIGNIKVGPIIQPHRITDFSILIGDDNFRGKGIAQEAFVIGNHITFEVHDLRKISSGMYSKNRSSFIALKKSGWVIEGVRLGHYLVDGEPMDQIQVSSFNPRYFSAEEIAKRFPDEDYV